MSRHHGYLTRRPREEVDGQQWQEPADGVGLPPPPNGRRVGSRRRCGVPARKAAIDGRYPGPRIALRLSFTAVNAGNAVVLRIGVHKSQVSEPRVWAIVLFRRAAV